MLIYTSTRGLAMRLNEVEIFIMEDITISEVEEV
jgi:hypothetical protein